MCMRLIHGGQVTLLSICSDLQMEEGNESTDVTPDEEPMRVLPLQTRMEEAHTELADDSISKSHRVHYYVCSLHSLNDKIM